MYSKSKGPQWKTKTKPSSSLQPIYEYGIILYINSTQELKKTVENQEKNLKLIQPMQQYPLKINKKFMNFVKAPLEEPYYSSLETWNKKTTVIFKKLEIILTYLYL